MESIEKHIERFQLLPVNDHPEWRWENLPIELLQQEYDKIESMAGEVIKEYKKQDTDLRVLSYKILLEKFNNKYGKLNLNQKNLLREYINNISNSKKLKEYSDNQAIKIASFIDNKSSKIKDKVVKIKLNEVKEQLVKMQSEKKLKDVHLVSLLRSYDLLKELKNVTKK